MAVVPIITAPNEALNITCVKAKPDAPDTKEVVKNLMDTLLAARNPEGAGLAAPQIGSDKRICIVRRFYPNPDGTGGTISKEYVLVNPKITNHSDDTQVGWEACLSIPNTYGPVRRFKKVKVTAQDENGNDIKLNASGFFSRVIQHELDHLDGILFTSKMEGKPITNKEFDKLYDNDEIDDEE